MNLPILQQSRCCGLIGVDKHVSLGPTTTLLFGRGCIIRFGCIMCMHGTVHTQPMPKLVFPMIPRSTRTQNESRPFVSVHGHAGHALNRLAQAHVIGNQRPALFGPHKIHAAPLKGRERLRESVGNSRLGHECATRGIALGLALAFEGGDLELGWGDAVDAARQVFEVGGDRVVGGEGNAPAAVLVFGFGSVVAHGAEGFAEARDGGGGCVGGGTEALDGELFDIQEGELVDAGANGSVSGGGRGSWGEREDFVPRRLEALGEIKVERSIHSIVGGKQKR